MTSFAVATSRHVRNPVRVQQWDASFSAGDDFILTLSVYDDNSATLTDLQSAAGALALFIDRADGRAGGYCCDYGWGYWTLPRQPVVVASGVISAQSKGTMVFTIAAADTALLHGRYRFILRIANADGVDSQVEGVLQVRKGWNAGLQYGGTFDPNTFDAEFTGGTAT